MNSWHSLNMSDLRLIDSELMEWWSWKVLSFTFSSSSSTSDSVTSVSVTDTRDCLFNFAFFIPVTVKETGKDKEKVFGGLQHFHIDDIYDCELWIWITFYTDKLFTPVMDCLILIFTMTHVSHTPSVTFWHLPPNSARFSYATEGTLLISAQLSTGAVSALWKVWVLIM